MGFAVPTQCEHLPRLNSNLFSEKSLFFFKNSIDKAGFIWYNRVT